MEYDPLIQLSYYWLPLIGFIIGLLATMVGGNGAFFFPPALILLFGVAPRLAIATSLAAVIPIGLIGSWEHYRRGNINLPVGLTFGLAGLLGALSGAWISGLIAPDSLIRIFGVYTIVLGLFALRLPKRKPELQVAPPVDFTALQKQQLPLILLFGLVSGTAAGLFGTSGTAPVLAALFMLHFPVKLVIGTSVLIVFVNALSGFGGHVLLGDTDLALILLLGSGAAAGAFIGPRLLAHIRPERKEGSIRYIFSAIVIAVGLLLVLG